MPKSLYYGPEEIRAKGTIHFEDIPVNAYNKTIAEERKNFAEELKELAYTEDAKGNTRTRALAAKLLLNADKSPEWFKLFLKLLGEMPSDELLVK